mgnify:FL=1
MKFNSNNMKEKGTEDVIDLREIVKVIYKKRKMFAWSLPIAFVLSCIWILPQPRTYVTSVTLAPEMTGEMTGGALGSIAASFGFNLGGGQTNDAIYPALYPDLFATNTFMISLLDIQVETIDESVKTDYYTYLTKHQKKNVLTAPFIYAKRKIKALMKETPKGKSVEGDGGINPYMPSEEQEMLLEGMKSNITCDVDVKTEMIVITVQDQDPLVCAIIADSVCGRLQKFITDYRTSKARNDYAYYKNLTKEAKDDYEKAVDVYSDFCDANRNPILQSALSKRDKLENDMQIKLNTYNAMSTQLEASKAKVQENTPAFTVLQSAYVPVKPEKPKRMLFVAGMLFLTFLGTIFYMFKEDIKNQLMPPSNRG